MRNAITRIREKIVNTNDIVERKKLQKRNVNVIIFYFTLLSVATKLLFVHQRRSIHL